MVARTVNVVCPKCGSEQEGGIQCRNCFAVLADQKRIAARRGPRAQTDYTPARGKSGGVFRLIYRIFTWTSLAFLVLAVVLILRKSAPPQVPIDPHAGRPRSGLRALRFSWPGSFPAAGGPPGRREWLPAF